MTMPAGKYYIGDLCYVMHPQWEEFCDLTIKNHECLDGEFKLKNGVKFCQYGTAYGDGVYFDQYNNEYGVDAGLIGCIKVEDIDDKDAYVEGGQIINFTSDFECSYNNGIITIGHLNIDTDPNYDEIEE